MYNIVKFIEKYALADAGMNEDLRESFASARTIPDWSNAFLDEQQLTRIHALRELVHWRSMDGATLAETMTTAHFTALFSDALDRKFWKDYQYQGGEWPAYIFPDTVPDFRDVKRFRMTETENLVLREEKQNHRDTFIQPSVKDYGVEEYSRDFDVSWRVIMNDDMGKIIETPLRMANAARRTVDAFVSNLYDNATSQSGLIALGATYAGTGRLTTANLAIGVNAMMSRVDNLGNPIDPGPIHLVIPQVLSIQAATVLKDIISYGGPNSNVMQGFIAGVHIDPYIASAPPNVPWYLFAEPTRIPAVTLARLQGWARPAVMMKSSDIQMINGSVPAPFMMGDFDTGNIYYAVVDVFGGDDDSTYGGITDYQGIYYSSGTTA